MSLIWETLLTMLAGLVLVWLVLVGVVLLAGRRYQRLSVVQVLRLLPDTVRLIRRLAADRSLPRRVRLWLLLPLGYLLMPIDLIPDFVPVAGYADDVVVVALTLRVVARRAGIEALVRHWPGTREGLEAVTRAVGLRLPE